MACLVFDIETGPLPEEVLRKRIKPYPEFVETPFDPASVKVGNLKDPSKIEAKIEEARRQHANAKEDHARAAEEYWRAEVGRAALSPLTGQVVAIGMCLASGGKENGQAIQIAGTGPKLSEENLLGAFWKKYRWAISKNVRIVGHNICGFDFPFLIRRSWILGIPVPDGILDRDRYWNPLFVDTMVRWQCGARGEFASLDTLAQATGHAGKNGDGADFARLWFGTPEEHAQAILYLKNDIEMTVEVAKTLGVV